MFRFGVFAQYITYTQPVIIFVLNFPYFKYEDMKCMVEILLLKFQVCKI